MKIYDFYGSANISGRRVKEARKNLGLSQDELAARLQVENVIVSQKGVSRMETGERLITDYELMALSKALNKDVEWLFGAEDVKK